MTTKSKTALARPKAEHYPRKDVTCQSGPSVDEKGRSYAKMITSAELAAYRVIGMMQPKNLADEIDTPTLLATLRDQAAAVQSGDLSHAEAMLINQASSLQALFVRLSERAIEQTLMPNIEGFMRLALRAQSQCRATLETLAAMKNPPVIFAKQANIASGHQQINNGTATPSHAEEKTIQSNELSGAGNELLPDARASSLTSQVNQDVETVGKVHRAKD